MPMPTPTSTPALRPSSPMEQVFPEVDGVPPTKKRRKTISRKYPTNEQMLLYGGVKIHMQVNIEWSNSHGQKDHKSDGKSLMIIHFNFVIQAISENKGLSETGVKFALQIAAGLESKGFGAVCKEGSQHFFIISQDKILEKYEELGVAKEVCFIPNLHEQQLISFI